ncbi:ChaN family lipoprotein [Terasakiella sp. SH-1]|uniref:ChaN family lipoprotein n=1 Tax=Terasakiella sp. SH-1 TaxID=2560057 RepID=UPI00142F6131|nr:ChaN family lipoprotein [Terasakiella sp. SH-1]
MSLKKQLLTAVAFSLFLVTHAHGEESDTSCIQRAQWISPQTKQVLDQHALIKQAAQEKIVLLGEQHPDAVHHRWQLQTITQLYAHNSNIVIGFEMFPRRIQPVLDAWVRGELSEEEFLERSDWDEVWKHDADLYMPLFRFARMNRLPIVALNVDRTLIGEISQKGWDGVEEERREGVQTPRPASPEYLTSLKEVFSYHTHVHSDEKKDDEKSKARFQRFVEAQLTWDGAMAQGLAHVQQLGGNPLVIGIMGSGHLANRHGVPHQLDGLGLNSTVLLPWTLGWNCNDLTPTYGDAIFGLEAMEEKPAQHKPMLGVRIDKTEDDSGVLIIQIVEESVAEDAGLGEGDIIRKAAGLTTTSPAELVQIIQRQAAGTWLPLEVQRGDTTLEIIAKFPTAP